MSAIETGWGLDVVLWLQRTLWDLLPLFRLLHYAGHEGFFLAALPLVYWCLDVRTGRRVALVFVLSAWSNMAAKQLFHRPRPFQVSPEVRVAYEEHTYGIPSGHTQNAVMLWGMLLLRYRTRWLGWLALVFAIVMGLSRMALGVHYPQDVIAGALLGLGWLGVYVAMERWLVPWLPTRPLRDHAVLVVAAVAAMLLIYPGLVRPDTAAAWKHSMTPPGALLGLGLGFALEPRWVRFGVAGPWWQRLVRLLLGLAVMAGLRELVTLPWGAAEPPLAVQFVRYFIVGLWAALGAPWLFVKLRLAPHRVLAESSTAAEPIA